MSQAAIWPRATALVIAGLSSTAVAAAGPASYCRPPTAANPSPAVDKNELAGFLLDQAQVSRRIEDLIAASALTGHKDAPAHIRTLLNATANCTALGCTPDEQKALFAARASFADLEGDSNLIFSHKSDNTVAFPGSIVDFMTDASFTLACKKGAKPAPAAMSPSAAGSAKSSVPVDTPTGADEAGNTGFDPKKIRIRDKPENLIFSRDSPSFSNAGKATISFADDRTSDKQSLKIIGGIGYPVQLRTITDPHFYLIPSLIPYVAFDIDRSKTGDKPKSITSDTIEFGIVLDAAIGNRVARGKQSSGEDIALVPKFILNNDDHSRIIGANLIFRPFPFRGVNTPIGIEGLPFKWNLILNARLNSGHFTAIGTRDPAKAMDFSRIGGQIGLVFASDKTFAVPVDLTVSDTYLYALAGDPNHLSLLASDITFYFDKDKHFGLDVGYSRGRVEDLDDSQHKWTVGLSVKY